MSDDIVFKEIRLKKIYENALKVYIGEAKNEYEDDLYKSFKNVLIKGKKKISNIKKSNINSLKIAGGNIKNEIDVILIEYEKLDEGKRILGKRKGKQILNPYKDETKDFIENNDLSGLEKNVLISYLDSNKIDTIESFRDVLYGIDQIMAKLKIDDDIIVISEDLDKKVEGHVEVIEEKYIEFYNKIRNVKIDAHEVNILEKLTKNNLSSGEVKKEMRKSGVKSKNDVSKYVNKLERSGLIETGRDGNRNLHKITLGGKLKLIGNTHELKIDKFLCFLDELGIDEFNITEYTNTFSYDGDMKILKDASKIGFIEKDGDNYKIIK